MPRFAANLSTLFTERPFLERFGAAAACGFTAVECQFPYDAPVEAIAEELERHRLDLVLFNLPPGDLAAGERGIAILPDRRCEFRDALDRGLDHAAALGCRLLHCMAGLRPDALDMREAEAVYVENLRHAAAEARRGGVRIAVEPINPFDMPGYFLTSMDQAARLLDRAGQDDLVLQYDLYHQSRTGGELLGTFERHKPRIAHVQIAGNPGRHEPDTGEIDFRFVLAELDRRGYAGSVGCEYVPRGRTEDGLGWLAAYRRETP